MLDSEKPQEQPGEIEKTPADTTEIIVRHGKPVATIRSAKGTFVKSKKTMPKSEDVTRLMRNFLNQAEAGEDGRMRRGDISRMRKMLNNIFSIASTSPDQPVLDRSGQPIRDAAGKIITVTDAKIAMASVQAFKELMLRAYGKPATSDEELDALKTQGVKIVVIQPPPEMMNREVVEIKPRERLEPSFIDVEIVSENK